MLHFISVKILLTIILVLFSWKAAQPAHSQAPAPYDAYVKNLSSYREAHDLYLKARKSYQQFGTLKSKTDAEVATKTMLILRSETVISFLQLAQERVGEQADYNFYAKDTLYTEVSYYQQNLEGIKLASSLENLLIISDNFQKHYLESTSKFIPIVPQFVNLRLLIGYANFLNQQSLLYSDRISGLPNDKPKEELTKNLKDANKSLEKAVSLINLSSTSLANAKDNPAKASQSARTNLSLAKESIIKSHNYLVEIDTQIKR